MTELLTRSGAWLLQNVPATLPDTFVMKTVAAERGWFETMTGVASGIMSVTLLGLAIFLAPAAWSFWRTFRKVREIVDRVYADVSPLTRHASNIADNLDYITTSIRSDVQQVNATIASANRKLQQAVQLTETRLNEFNALLHVVQQEAEQTFVSTAAAVRGVRTGAATLGFDEESQSDAVIGGRDNGDDDDENTADERGDELEPVERDASPRPRLKSRRRV